MAQVSESFLDLFWQFCISVSRVAKELAAKELGFLHLSAGELLRQECGTRIVLPFCGWGHDVVTCAGKE